MEIVIIGASFAGLTAAIECRAAYPEASIHLIDREKEVGYYPNVLNWKVKGSLTSWDQARISLVKDAEQADLDWKLETSLIGLDCDRKTILLEKGKTVFELAYDYLILAMGASQVWERSSGELESRLLSSKTIGAAQASLEKLRDAQSIALIGGGQIGLESLEALSQLPVRLSLFEAQDSLLAKYFDREMTETLRLELEEAGLDLHLSETVNDIRFSASDQKVKLESIHGQYEADYLLIGTNFKPNSALFEGVLELNADGTIWVDAFLQTSQEAVFAVGDLIQLPFAFLGKAYLPMINHAILTGRLVAQNLVERKLPLKEVNRIISSHLFGYYLTSVGLTEAEAELRQEIRTIRLQRPFSDWDERLVDFKLVLAKESGRILGGQLVSKSQHLEQMDSLALAISRGLCLQDFLDQTWLCLPRSRPLVPLLVEAANLYQRQLHAED